MSQSSKSFDVSFPDLGGVFKMTVAAPRLDWPFPPPKPEHKPWEPLTPEEAERQRKLIEELLGIAKPPKFAPWARPREWTK